MTKKILSYEIHYRNKKVLLIWQICFCSVDVWLKQNTFLSHNHVNEMIALMGHDTLHTITSSAAPVVCLHCWWRHWSMMSPVLSSWPPYSWVLGNTWGLHWSISTSSTDTANIAAAIKDILICWGQAYDSAATMQGKWSGVASFIRNEEQQPFLSTVYPTPSNIV